MLRIGEFSQLSQVTIKTLHHYDEIGLFKPAHTDPNNGYRYYALEQLPRIHSIIALKELGLSLEQIGLILVDELSIDQMRALLQTKKVEIQAQLEAEQRHMALVENRLLMLESESNAPQIDVVLKEIEPQRVLSMRVSPQQPFHKVADELQHTLHSGAIDYTGSYMDVLYGGEINLDVPLDPDNFHHEVLLSVGERQSGNYELATVGTLFLREEPGLDCAATMMIHGLDRRARLVLIMHLQRWAVNQGFRLPGVLRLLHHRGPLETLDRSDWITEIQMEVRNEETAELG